MAPDEESERGGGAGASVWSRFAGMFESGVPDLGSNPKHLEGLGRDRSQRALDVSIGVRPALDAQTLRAVRAFLRRLEGGYPAIGALVFGSRARGTHRNDSDADLAVILAGSPGARYKVAGDMAEVAFDVMQETGVLIDPLPLWEDEWARPELFGNPALIEAIKREGVRV